jgi:hypothetical protein
MKRILTVLIIVVWGSLQLFAQQGLITGKVIDETGEAMLGVNVTIQGTTTGTITNAEGRYSLDGVCYRETLLNFPLWGWRPNRSRSQAWTR